MCRIVSVLVFTASLFLSASTLFAQAADLTLPQVLTRAQATFTAFAQTVPNLAADEHLTTDVGAAATTAVNLGGNTVLDHYVEAEATVTLRRDTETKDAAPRLIESREMKTIDRHPAKPDALLDAPTMLSDVFSYAGAFLQPQLTDCYDYKLKPNQKLQGRRVLVVEYDHNDKKPSSACAVPEPNSGRVFLDPDTLQVLRLEQHRSPYVANLEQPDGLDTMAKTRQTVTWDWSIDYAPVQLDGKTFLLPKTVNSSMKTLPRAEKPAHWSFTADYRNYRRLPGGAN